MTRSLILASGWHIGGGENVNSMTRWTTRSEITTAKEQTGKHTYRVSLARRYLLRVVRRPHIPIRAQHTSSREDAVRQHWNPDEGAEAAGWTDWNAKGVRRILPGLQEEGRECCERQGGRGAELDEDRACCPIMEIRLIFTASSRSAKSGWWHRIERLSDPPLLTLLVVSCETCLATIASKYIGRKKAGKKEVIR